MLFKRLAHVCLIVKDLQRSLDYYHKLGMTDVFKFTRKGGDYGMYLKISDNNFIEMFEEPGGEPVVNTGITHFCLESENLDDLISHLMAEGISFTEKKQGCDFTWQIWLEDPDGNKFEVHQYSDKSLQLRGGTVGADW